jgi:ribosomal protein L7/L12
MSISFLIIAIALVFLGFVLGFQVKQFLDSSSNRDAPSVEGLQGDLSQHEDTLRALLLQNRKIEAIKHYRRLTGQGLLPAKEYIEALEHKMKNDRA